MPKNKPNLAVNVTPEPARPTSTTNIKGSQSVPIGRSNKPVPQVVVSVTTQGEDRRGAAAAYLFILCIFHYVLCYYRNRTDSGTFKHSDFIVNKAGIQIGNKPSPQLSSSESASNAGPSTIDASPRVKVSSLEELESVRVEGRGASGTVAQVIHKPSKTVLALKMVSLDVTEKALQSNLNELRTLYENTSPYIVAFYGAFYAEAMEFMDATLSDAVVYGGPLPERILAFVSDQMLRGLDYLHVERKMMHRDIKPSNILMSLKGTVKLTDFGVSNRLTDFVGTTTYMSPERIQGAKYGQQGDIWSLGLVLFECVTGKFPFEMGENAGFWELLARIVEEQPPRLKPSDCSPDLIDFVDCMLKKDPNQRWSAAQLLEHPFLKRIRGPGLFDGCPELVAFLRAAIEHREDRRKARECSAI